MEDIYIGHNYIEDVAQGGIDLCDARNAVVEYNVVDGFLKRYPNFRPTVALYPWKCENSVLQYNEVYNGPSTNADGSPYDMDSALKKCCLPVQLLAQQSLWLDVVHGAQYQ